MQPGLTLITSFWKDDDGGHAGLRLINMKGETVHEWIINRAKLFPDSMDVLDVPELRALHGTYLFPNGDVLVNVEYVGTVRLDACGRVLWRLPAATHHSIARAADGSFWIPGATSKPHVEYSNTPFDLNEDAYIKQILHVSADGEILDKFSVLEIIRANDLGRYIARAYVSEPTSDVTHLNDVEPLHPSMADEYPLFEAGDLLVSLRNINLVFVFDPESGEVKWHASDPFEHQHDADFIGDGWIGVFNNNRDFTIRGSILGGSQIIALRPHTDSMKVLFPTQHSSSFYTPIRGKWQMLKNGNMLLTEAQGGRVLEVTPDGRTVWSWIKEPYSPSRGLLVTEATRYPLTREDVSTWPCSSIGSTRNPQ